MRMSRSWPGCFCQGLISARRLADDVVDARLRHAGLPGGGGGGGGIADLQHVGQGIKEVQLADREEAMLADTSVPASEHPPRRAADALSQSSRAS